MSNGHVKPEMRLLTFQKIVFVGYGAILDAWTYFHAQTVRITATADSKADPPCNIGKVTKTLNYS